MQPCAVTSAVSAISWVNLWFAKKDSIYWILLRMYARQFAKALGLKYSKTFPSMMQRNLYVH
jgi:hypothetical protein